MAVIGHGLEVALSADKLFELHICVVAQVHFGAMTLRELLMVSRRLCLNRLSLLWILHYIYLDFLPESVRFLCGLLGVRSDRK